MKSTLENRLQNSLQEMLGLKHVLLTGYSRNALFLLIKAFNWGEGAEIIIPAFTCPVIKKTVEAAGAFPVPVEPEEQGLNIDPLMVEKAVTGRTKAILVVHSYGTAAAIERICATARRRGIVVIEDLAHSLFNRHGGRLLGTYGDFALLSFTKKVVNYEGGGIATNNTAVYERMMSLREVYPRQPRLGFADFIDHYVRVVGSWWESGFSPAALLLMKLNDMVNDIVYRGQYGISVDERRFHPRELGLKLTLRQIGGLAAGSRAVRHAEFRERFSGSVNVADCNGADGDTLPAYMAGILRMRGVLYRMLSFRTWHNCNVRGFYPRADSLFENYRIFARSIMLYNPRAFEALKESSAGRGRKLKMNDIK